MIFKIEIPVRKQGRGSDKDLIKLIPDILCIIRVLSDSQPVPEPSFRIQDVPEIIQQHLAPGNQCLIVRQIIHLSFVISGHRDIDGTSLPFSQQIDQSFHRESCCTVHMEQSPFRHPAKHVHQRILLRAHLLFISCKRHGSGIRNDPSLIGTSVEILGALQTAFQTFFQFSLSSGSRSQSGPFFIKPPFPVLFRHPNVMIHRYRGTTFPVILIL